MTFSAPVFILFRFGFSESSDGFPCARGRDEDDSDTGDLTVAISVTDCESDCGRSPLTELSDEPGEPTDTLDKPDDLDLSEGAAGITYGIDSLDVAGDGVEKCAFDVMEREPRVGVALGDTKVVGGDFGRRNLFVLLRILKPGVRPRFLLSDGDDVAEFATGLGVSSCATRCDDDGRLGRWFEEVLRNTASLYRSTTPRANKLLVLILPLISSPPGGAKAD